MRTLAKRLKKRGAQTRLAHLLEIEQGAVSRWVAGTMRPAAHLRLAIELLFQIPATDWMTKVEAELLEKVRGLAAAEGAKAA